MTQFGFSESLFRRSCALPRHLHDDFLDFLPLLDLPNERQSNLELLRLVTSLRRPLNHHVHPQTVHAHDLRSLNVDPNVVLDHGDRGVGVVVVHVRGHHAADF